MTGLPRRLTDGDGRPCSGLACRCGREQSIGHAPSFGRGPIVDRRAQRETPAQVSPSAARSRGPFLRDTTDAVRSLASHQTFVLLLGVPVLSESGHRHDSASVCGPSGTAHTPFRLDLWRGPPCGARNHGRLQSDTTLDATPPSVPGTGEDSRRTWGPGILSRQDPHLIGRPSWLSVVKSPG